MMHQIFGKMSDKYCRTECILVIVNRNEHSNSNLRWQSNPPEQLDIGRRCSVAIAETMIGTMNAKEIPAATENAAALTTTSDLRIVDKRKIWQVMYVKTADPQRFALLPSGRQYGGLHLSLYIL